MGNNRHTGATEASKPTVGRVPAEQQIEVLLRNQRSTAQDDRHKSNGARRKQIGGVVIGVLVGYDEDGNPLVDFPGNCKGRPIVARSTVEFNNVEQNVELVLMFEQSDASRPIVLGVTQKPSSSANQERMQAKLDDERIVLSAEREIVLKCGKASITLTRAGKVLIRGAFLLSRSSGTNRIKGGSVQIN